MCEVLESVLNQNPIPYASLIREAKDNQDFDQLLTIENQLQFKEQNLVQQINELFISNKLDLIVEPIKQLSFYVKLQQLVAASIAEI